MEPALDPPPPANYPAAAVPPTAVAANPSPTQATVHRHPPYVEMITAAISALNERDGSSRRAIAKFIETQYPSLPPTHSALLTHHLKRLKTSGQLVMVKHSYKLPRSAAAPVNGAVNAVPTDPASSVPKKRPGRPPKAKPETVQAPLPVFVPPVNVNAAPAVGHEIPLAQNAVVEPGTGYAAIGPVNGPSTALSARGRGRPSKRGGIKRGAGRPPKNPAPQTGVAVGRGRGRPKRGTAPPSAAVARTERPRGRPPKPVYAAPEAAAVAAVGGGVPPAPVAAAFAPPVAGKRRGRPPGAGGVAKKPRIPKAGAQPKKPRKLSGRPLGRPKKDASSLASQSPDTQLLVAYLDLKGNLENLQSRIKQAAVVINPCLNNEGAIAAMHELELLASVNIAPLNVQLQQPAPQPPQPPQPLVQPPQPEPTQLLQPQVQS